VVVDLRFSPPTYGWASVVDYRDLGENPRDELDSADQAVACG